MDTKYNSVKTVSFKVNNIKEDLAMLMFNRSFLVVTGLNESSKFRQSASRAKMKSLNRWTAKNSLKKVCSKA